MVAFWQYWALRLCEENRWEEAETVVKQAMGAPSIVPGIQRDSYLLAAALAARKFAKSKDPAELERELEYLQKRRQIGKLDLPFLKIGFTCARKLKHYAVARQYASEARKAAPNDLALMADQAELEIESGDYLTALRYAEAGLATDTSNQRLATLIGVARNRLNEFLQKNKE